jgi:beta-lactamase regulating signal transducer with metallopeptidase domain
MSPLPTWDAWWPWLVVLASEVVLVVGAAALLQRWTKSALWRRTIWQGGMLALLALVALEFTGTARGLVNSSQKRISAPVAQVHRPPSASRAITLTPLPFPRPGLTTLVTPNAPRAPQATLGSRFVAVLDLLWLTGAALVLLRCVMARLAFALFRLRSVPVKDANLRKRVRTLAERLRIRWSVRVLESRRFATPIAFGLLRPAIGLPPQFVARYPLAQQDVMVAHELAHLAAGDPFWYLLAEIAVALLWWHPLAWWARRQLQAASETAADDASLLLDDGPKVLAECLVELGNRLAPVRPSRWMGIDGFRSGLGRRVQRLMQLPGTSWSPPGQIRSGLAKTFGPAGLVSGVIFCTAWTIPQSSSNGALMKWQNWKQTLGAFTLVAAVNGGNPSTPAAEPTQPVENPPPEPSAVSAGARDEIAWQNWNPAAVAKARSEGRPVMVNFTADWCQTCQVNSKTSLEIPAVRQRLKTIQAATFLGDYTRANELIDNELKKFGRAGVPLVLVYPHDPHDPNAAPLVLPNLLTPQLVMDALQYAILPEEQFITPAIRPLVEAARRGDPKAASVGEFGSNGFGSSGGAHTLQRKLETIRLDEVAFDAVPLSIVVAQLVQESTKRDPAKRGVNFLFSQPTDLAPINPATGLPERPASSVDVKDTTIRILPPLKNVRLIDVLNAITRVTDPPVRFSIEEYAVVFSAGSPAGAAVSATASSEAVPLVVKTFRINTNTFSTGVGRAFRINFSPNVPLASVAEHVFTQLGVNMSAPKGVFYNDLTGILMARVTAEDMVVVQAAMETLGGVTEGQSQAASISSPRAAAAAEEAVVKLIQALSKAIPEVGK